MRRLAPVSLILFLAAFPLAGCGQDKVERGLAPVDETAAPDSPAADAETDQQRQQQLTNEMDKKLDQEFDAAAGGDAPPPKPAQ